LLTFNNLVELIKQDIIKAISGRIIVTQEAEIDDKTRTMMQQRQLAGTMYTWVLAPAVLLLLGVVVVMSSDVALKVRFGLST